MLHTPLWKRVLVWAIVVLGVLFAAPNLFYARVEARNDAATAVDKAGFTTPENQAALDGWPSFLPNGIVNLGLDLRGGAHLLAEVQLSDAYKARMDALWPELRDAMKGLRDQVGTVRRIASAPDTLKVQISNPAGLSVAAAAVEKLSQPVVSLTGAGQRDLVITAEADTITITLSAAEKSATDLRTMNQSLEIIRTRVDQAGTREPTIQREGSDRILIQVPGLGSAEELKALIGTTAKLTFQPVIRRTANASEVPGPGNILLPSLDDKGVFYVLNETPVVTGDNLTKANPSFDQNNRPAVEFQFDTSGARKFGDYTAQNIGSPFAIVLDGKVISAPVIQSHIPGGRGIITGNFTVEESSRLAVLLSAGALPAGMTFLEERTIGPELGQDSIDAGKLSVAVAVVAVVALMVASYGLFGGFAALALGVNMVLIFAVLSLIGATLTLPGIAGLVLTIGMAVDANVLIFERIRDEWRHHPKNPARAIELGFERALSAIIDANVTTLITAAVLFFTGSGTVRGFAVTLAIGIVTSVFTATQLTRLIIELWFGWRRPRALTV